MSGKQQLDVADTPSGSSASVSPRLSTNSVSPAPPNGIKDNNNGNENRRRRRRKKRGDPPVGAVATPNGGGRDSSVSSRSRSIGSQSQFSKVSKSR